MSPISIYPSGLDVVTAAVPAGDLDAYAAMIDLPYLVHAGTADLLVSDREGLRPTFQALGDGLRVRDVTQCERIARAAGCVDRDGIEGTAHSHVASPTIVRRDDRWLFSQARYRSLQTRRWPFADAQVFGHFDQTADAETAS